MIPRDSDFAELFPISFNSSFPPAAGRPHTNFERSASRLLAGNFAKLIRFIQPRPAAAAALPAYKSPLKLQSHPLPQFVQRNFVLLIIVPVSVLIQLELVTSSSWVCWRARAAYGELARQACQR